MNADTMTAQERMTRLQQVFHQGLPGRMHELLSLWKDLNSAWLTESQDVFHHRIHSLAGTAGTFGATTISQCATRIELALKPLVEGQQQPTDEQRAFLENEMQQLQRLAAGWDPASTPQLPPDQEPVRQRGNDLIYVVDDDDLVGRMLVEELSAADYSAQWFSTTDKFMEACKKQNPAVVVMDMVFADSADAGAAAVSGMMPEMNPAPHIVFVSVRDDIEARLAAVRVGAKRYFTKPIKMREFVHTLDGLTEKTISDPYRILLVDDEKSVASYYAAVLEERGIRTHVLTDPMQCLEAIAAFKPDMVLMDIYMPGCTGIELAAVIRQDDKFAQMPITFLSSEEQLDKKLAAMHLGGDDFLTKPVKPDHLVEACLARVKRSRQNTWLNRRLQHALRESEYRQLALNQHSIVSATDADGTITLVNRKFCDISKYTETELVGNYHNLINSGYHTPGFFQDMWNTLVKGSVWHGVVCNRNKNGERYWVDTTIVPFLNQDNLPYQYVSVSTDITELVESRNAILKAKDEAERASSAKTVFLSNMSHELRTPLNAILGFGQLLESSDISEKYKDEVREIVKAGNHQLHLINEILDLARIEAGRIELHMEPVQLASVVKGCQSLMAPLVEKRELELRVAPECAADIWVEADQRRLMQVVLNLMSNAIKYNKQGGKIQVECTEGGSGRVRLSVIDTGIGINSEDQLDLFQPFSRLSNADDGIEGTGIGLSITRRLVEQMGGEIGFQSEPGLGSTFWVEFLKSDSVDARTTNNDEASHDAGPEQTNDTRIIYIEDNIANIKLVEKIIARRPRAQLVTEQDPAAGVRLVNSTLPNLVLVDINMPGMSGFDVLRKLRENPDTRQIPVIAVSAKAMSEEIQNATDAGFDGYVCKPIDIGLFNQTIDSVLKV